MSRTTFAALLQKYQSGNASEAGTGGLMCNSNICIDVQKCFANEARVGGVVIEKP